ncbi:hypothetical protein LX99_04151 [Mucilaginibacter oryzae]|uniref:Uncharacterized protein n=1 Tax=Mucilaginibacter oryzae TaxID=468058 RepID=A0A316H2D6_9SPHI|nr:hypothetical protein LX99_04151 [Mucilaginibacter oryzae]
MLAAAAMNFKRMMNIWKNNLWRFFFTSFSSSKKHTTTIYYINP